MLEALLDAPLRHRAAIAEAERLLRAHGRQAAQIALGASMRPGLMEREREHLRRAARIAARRQAERLGRESRHAGLGR